VGSRGAHEHGRVSACDSPPHHSHDVSACSVVDLDQQGGGRVCVCMYACAIMCVFVFCVLAPVFWLAQARLKNFLHCLGLVLRGIETAAGTLVPFWGHKTIIFLQRWSVPKQGWFRNVNWVWWPGLATIKLSTQRLLIAPELECCQLADQCLIARGMNPISHHHSLISHHPLTWFVSFLYESSIIQ
jgi:hypothetical protein